MKYNPETQEITYEFADFIVLGAYMRIAHTTLKMVTRSNNPLPISKTNAKEINKLISLLESIMDSISDDAESSLMWLSDDEYKTLFSTLRPYECAAFDSRCLQISRSIISNFAHGIYNVRFVEQGKEGDKE